MLLLMGDEKLGSEPNNVVWQISRVGADDLLEIVIVGIEPETHNEFKEKKEVITDISGTETSTESDANK